MKTNESEVTSYNPNNESLIPNNDVVQNEVEEEPIHHINENQGVVNSTPYLLEKSSLPNNEVEQTSENEIPSSSQIVTPNFENETIPPNQNEKISLKKGYTQKNVPIITDLGNNLLPLLVTN